MPRSRRLCRQPGRHRLTDLRRKARQEGAAIARGQRLEEHVLPRRQPMEQAHEGGRIGRAHVGDPRRGQRQQQHHVVAPLVVADLRYLRRHDEPAPKQAGKRGIELARHRPDDVPRVEPAFGGRPHDPEGGAVECGRARSVLEIRERRLLVTVQAQHRARHRHVLGRTGRAAGLAVKERRLCRQRRRACGALRFDVRGQVVVALDRHGGVIVTRRGEARESVRASKRRVLVGSQQALQYAGLGGSRVAGQRFEGPPLAEPQPRHGGACR